MTGTKLILRGSYCPPGETPKDGTKKLHLFLSASSPLQLLEANKVLEIYSTTGGFDKPQQTTPKIILCPTLSSSHPTAQPSIQLIPLSALLLTARKLPMYPIIEKLQGPNQQNFNHIQLVTGAAISFVASNNAPWVFGQPLPDLFCLKVICATSNGLQTAVNLVGSLLSTIQGDIETQLSLHLGKLSTPMPPFPPPMSSRQDSPKASSISSPVAPVFPPGSAILPAWVPSLPPPPPPPVFRNPSLPPPLPQTNQFLPSQLNFPLVSIPPFLPSQHELQKQQFQQQLHQQIKQQQHHQHFQQQQQLQQQQQQKDCRQQNQQLVVPTPTIVKKRGFQEKQDYVKPKQTNNNSEKEKRISIDPSQVLKRKKEELERDLKVEIREESGFQINHNNLAPLWSISAVAAVTSTVVSVVDDSSPFEGIEKSIVSKPDGTTEISPNELEVEDPIARFRLARQKKKQEQEQENLIPVQHLSRPESNGLEQSNLDSEPIDSIQSGSAVHQVVSFQPLPGMEMYDSD